MRGYSLFAIALLVCVLACAGCADSGTSTGNPSPKEDAGDRDMDGDSAGGLANGGYCEAGAMTPLELDEDSPLGFAMTDILAFAEGTHEEAIRWNPQPGLELSPESGQGSITIIVTASGAPRFVEPKQPEGGNALIDLPAVEGGCVSWIEIDVDVTVETSGGALDESFEAVLRAHDPRTASIYATLDPTKLGGDFTVDITGSELEGFTLTDLYFEARFSQYGAGGTFRGLLEHRSDDTDVAAGTGAEPFADFGAGTCGENADGFTVALDDAIEGVTVQDALDLFNANGEVDITWETGAMTTSSLVFAPDTAGGCVLLDNEQVGDLTLLSDGTLTMVSADGRLDAAWPGRIEAHVADGGSIARVQFMLSAKLPPHTMPGANALYGFPMDVIDTFDGAGVGAEIAVTESGATGVVSLNGYDYQDCDAVPPDQPGDGDPSDPGSSGSGMSTGDCRGADAITIARGTLE